MNPSTPALHKELSNQHPRVMVLLAINAALILTYGVLWVRIAFQDEFWRADFSAFYTGWVMVLHGESANLYDLKTQNRYQQRLVPEREGQLLPFVNPPHAALPFAPLALLSRTTAFYTWTALQLLLLVPFACYLRQLTSDWRLPRYLALLVTALAFPALLYTFQLGQLSLLLTVCLLGFYSALKRSRPTEVALWLVLGTIKPQLMVIPATTLLANRQWRALLLATLFLALWVLVTTLILGWGAWVGFVEMIRYSSQQFGTAAIDPLKMTNLKGFLTALLGFDHATLINLMSAGALGLAILVTLWLGWNQQPAHATRFERFAAFTLMLGMVCNLHFNQADALALVVPAVLFVHHLNDSVRSGRWFLTLMLCGPLLFLIDRYAMNPWPGHIRPFFFVMLLVLGWMGWYVIRDRKEWIALD